jgi:hypothetical protein
VTNGPIKKLISPWMNECIFLAQQFTDTVNFLCAFQGQGYKIVKCNTAAITTFEQCCKEIITINIYSDQLSSGKESFRHGSSCGMGYKSSYPKVKNIFSA